MLSILNSILTPSQSQRQPATDSSECFKNGWLTTRRDMARDAIYLREWLAT